MASSKAVLHTHVAECAFSLAELAHAEPACLLSHPACRHNVSCPITTSSNQLQHSTTVLFYLLPPHGPLAQLDLLLMAALSQHVPLVPVIVMPDKASANTPEADAYGDSVVARLKDVQLPGLQLGAAEVFDK